MRQNLDNINPTHISSNLPNIECVFIYKDYTEVLVGGDLQSRW